MAEWPNAVVLKTIEPQGSEGSNPSLSAIRRAPRCSACSWQARYYYHYDFTTALPFEKRRSPEPVEGLSRVYILLCANGALYTGQSCNIKQRLARHANGDGARHTRLLKHFQLIYFEGPMSAEDAVTRERQLKGWTRAKKLALICGDQTGLKKLSRSRERMLQNKRNPFIRTTVSLLSSTQSNRIKRGESNPSRGFDWRTEALKRAGLLIEADDIKRENRKRKKSGQPPLELELKSPPKNCFCHSFVTYHVALHRDPGKTAFFVSHRDQDCLYRHYLGIATKENAREYFKILLRLRVFLALLKEVLSVQ